MASSQILNFDIREPLWQHHTKREVLNIIWGSDFTISAFSTELLPGDSFIRYYTEQCRNALARHTNGLNGILGTHQDIAYVVQKLQSSESSRDDIKDDLRKRGPLPDVSHNEGEALLDEAIDLAVRLWLMIDIGEMIHSFIPGQKSLQWQSGSLRNLVHGHFTPHIAIHERVKLDRVFNARNLERIAGLQIVWTSNLADHLRLMVDDTRIAIFHYAYFLEYQKTNQFFPPGLIQETLETLSLLLPQHDKKCRKWFRAHRNKWFLDEKAATCRHLTTEERQIENFVFWHDRLVILKQVFDQAEPSTIAQWWCDRRRRVQWYTFWVAALVLSLTIFFGVIQCLEGGLQVYKAYHP